MTRNGPAVRDEGIEPSRRERLGRDFFQRDVIEVARDLLGCVLAISGPDGQVAIRITETEAYGGTEPDPGSHAHRSRTPRNDVMFGVGGLAYVYRSYGIHWCLNLVTGGVGDPAAVLVRAGEVVSGLELARVRRGLGERVIPDRDLARGPGRLCAAAGVTAAHNRTDATTADGLGVWMLGALGTGPLQRQDGHPEGRIGVSTRTGVSGAGASLPYRFFLPGESTVSPHRPVLRPQGRNRGR